MKKLLCSLLFSLIVVLGFALPATATQIQGGDKVEVKSGKSINDNLFVVGNKVVIDDPVQGDLMAFAQIVEVNAPVGGNIFSAAQSIRIKNNVGRDVFAAAQDITIEESAVVSGDIFLAAATVDLSGIVGGTARVGAGDLEINGPIAKDLFASLNTASLGEKGAIGGNVVYHAQKQIDALVSDKIKGTVKFVPVENKQLVKTDWQGWLLGVLALMIFALIVARTAPRYTTQLGELTWLDFWLGIVWSILGLIILSVGAIILLFSLIGIPLAVVAGFILFVMFYLARLPFAIWLGRVVIPKANRYLQMLLGIALVSVIFVVPFVGPTVQVITAVAGSGIIILKAYRLEKELLKKKAI